MHELLTFIIPYAITALELIGVIKFQLAATGKNGVTANVCSNAYSAGTSVKE